MATVSREKAESLDKIVMGMLEGVDDFRIVNMKEIINKIKTIMWVWTTSVNVSSKRFQRSHQISFKLKWFPSNNQLNESHNKVIITLLIHRAYIPQWMMGNSLTEDEETRIESDVDLQRDNDDNMSWTS